ncbi:MAG TPA: hypothetical protein VHF25_06990 [Nitriliruptorales bacterium]|nr:hypothetical protein [Nitriliruptorales bacterium]
MAVGSSRKITIEVVGQADSAVRAFKNVAGAADQTGGKLDRFRDRMEGVRNKLAVAGGALTAFVSAPIVGFLNDATNKAASYGDAVNRLRVLTGPLADETVAWADSLLKTHGIGKQLGVDMVGTFTSILTAQGMTTKAAVEQSQRWVQLSADAASFYDLPHQEVQEAITAGLRGEYEQLEKLNVFLKEEDVNKKALLQTGKQRAADLTDQEKAAARVALITEGLMRVEGDYARTAGDVNNRTREQQQALDDLQIEIGTKLIPVKQRLLDITGQVLDRFANLSPEAQNLALIAAGLAVALGPVALGLSAVASVLTISTTPAVIALGAALWGLATNPVVLAVSALVLLGAGLYAAYQRSDEFRQRVDILIDVLGVTLGATISGLLTILRGLVNGVLLSAESFLTLAAAAAGWVTPLGVSLRNAREDVGATRSRINSELDAIIDRVDTFVVTHAEQAMAEIRRVRNELASIPRVVAVEIRAEGPTVTRGTGRMRGTVPVGQHGGIVPGRPGQAVPMLAHAGEMVIPRRLVEMIGGRGGMGRAAIGMAATGGGATVVQHFNFSFPNYVGDRRQLIAVVQRALRDYARANGQSSALRALGLA